MSGIKDEDYLGDGAYIARDEYGGIILAANDKVSGEPTSMVYLDQDGVAALKRYIERYML
jgi:hypothetical protein